MRELIKSTAILFALAMLLAYLFSGPADNPSAPDWGHCGRSTSASC